MSNEWSVPRILCPSSPLRWTSFSADWRRRSAVAYSPRTYIQPFVEPVLTAAIVIASIKAKGSFSRIILSLKVPGSLSSALTTICFPYASCAATAFHLTPVGNAAPPRPVKPASVMRLMTASPPMERAVSKARYPPLSRYERKSEGSTLPKRRSSLPLNEVSKACLELSSAVMSTGSELLAWTK